MLIADRAKRCRFAWSLGGIGLLLLCAGCRLSQSPTPVIPRRATLSSDTGTTQPQTFELEGGIGYDPNSAWNTPMELKYGLDDTSEVFTPRVVQRKAGGAGPLGACPTGRPPGVP